MTQFRDLPAAPKPYGTTWPSQWPEVAQLEESLQRLQSSSNPGALWHNMTDRECRGNYTQNTYSTYRNVILVTDWHKEGSDNNSVLAVGSLPAYPANGTINRFVAICPAAYLAPTPGSSVPDNAPYIQHNFVENKTGFGAYKPSDLCYSYRLKNNSSYPDNGSESDPWISALAVELNYCLAEPQPLPPARFIYNRFTALIFVCFLCLKSVLMTIASYHIGTGHVPTKHNRELYKDVRVRIFSGFGALVLAEFADFSLVGFGAKKLLISGISTAQIGHTGG